jgi:hypothetical protein
VPSGISDGYYEEARGRSDNALQGSRTQPGTIMGDGPGLSRFQPFRYPTPADRAYRQRISLALLRPPTVSR